MNKANEDTKITQEDLLFLEKELSKIHKPLSLRELTKKLAYKKTAGQLRQEVKKYDPCCQYEVGDLIYKEYDEPLTISSKGVEPFRGNVVLKIVNKIDYESFHCEMLEVDYSGGGTFRKHIEYMKKTKTQVLLPSNLEGKAQDPKILEKKEDPRRSELPITERDLKKLEKNLKTALSKSAKFFSWNEYWQLNDKQTEIQEEKIKEIEKHLWKTKQSAETSDMVIQFLGLLPSDDQFALYCLSLNHILEKKYKKNFIYVSPVNWGKWHLKNILDSLLDNLPLSAPQAEVPHFEEEKKGETSKTPEYPIKIYLTWREILSGGLKIPKRLNKEMSISREYIFTDIEEKKDHTVYYYPSACFLLGLKEFYESNNVPQGASLTLERKSPANFSFRLKKSKKKLSVLKMDYDPKEDKFTKSEEEIFTFSLPNKIIHLENETLSKLFSLYNQRDNLDLRELLILIFKNFALQGNDFSLHYLRAYHLVDMLRQTTQEKVEKTLLNSSEFAKSEKKKGIFLYQEKIKAEEPVEIPAEIPAEEKVEEVPPVEAPVEEIPAPEIKEEKREEVRVEVPPEIEKAEVKRPPAAKKEKAIRKKKLKMEGEKVFRRRKGEKKFIEEKIELEESELEALLAVKAEEKKAIPAPREEPQKEKKRDFKPLVSEEPGFGLFAEKLKTALDKKKKEKKKK